MTATEGAVVERHGSTVEGSEKEWRLEGQSPVSEDDLLLIQMGKKPELKRVYNFWTLCGYQLLISSSWGCVIVLYGTIFDLGGPVSLVYGTIIVAIGQTLVMASLAEYCGIWPTAGGQQFYTQVLASPRWRPLLSYLVGWALLASELSGVASCALNSANIMSTFTTINHPDFDWKPWMTFLIYVAMCLVPLFMALEQRLLPSWSNIGAVLTVGGFVSWSIWVLVKAPKMDASFVFTTFLNNSGYPSSGWVFIMGFYNSLWGMSGTDAMMHMVEEMRDAARDAPRAMVWSMVFAGTTTLITDLIILFCAGNYETYSSSISPYIAWLANVDGSFWGCALYLGILFIVFNTIINIGVLSAASRLGWRMAEDQAFPFSKWLSVIHPRFRVPFNMMIAITVVEIIIGMRNIGTIILGSDVAFQALVSGSGVFCQTAYLVPIMAVVIRGRSILPPRRTFDLGRWAYVVNYIAVAWSFLVIMIWIFPLYYPVTSDTISNMNWAILVVAAEVMLSGGYWIFAARHKYIKNFNVPATMDTINRDSVTVTQQSNDQPEKLLTVRSRAVNSSLET